jgi:hypothetical protein
VGAAHRFPNAQQGWSLGRKSRAGLCRRSFGVAHAPETVAPSWRCVIHRRECRPCRSCRRSTKPYLNERDWVPLLRSSLFCFERARSVYGGACSGISASRARSEWSPTATACKSSPRFSPRYHLRQRILPCRRRTRRRTGKASTIPARQGPRCFPSERYAPLDSHVGV